VNVISEGFFDGHNVIFADSQKKLTSSHETSRLLVVGYNCFAEENGKESIDMEDIERSPRTTKQEIKNRFILRRSDGFFDDLHCVVFVQISSVSEVVRL
jgi:hypothetical protein